MLIQSLSFNTQKLRVGLFYQGGIIVYVDNNKRQGLIAYNTGFASNNLAWGPNGSYTQSSLYGQGFTNTQNAYNTLSPASNTALYTVWNGTFNGYSDWFLPNIAEATYVAAMADTGFNANPLDFWNFGTIWLSEAPPSPTSGIYAYDRDFPGAPFVTTRFRNETDNRNSIACRYITFT
jgi:hypothetical protein